MNERLHKLANQAACHANLNSGNDRDHGYYWTNVMCEKYTELLYEDMAKVLDSSPDMPARLLKGFIKSHWTTK